MELMEIFESGAKMGAKCPIYAKKGVATIFATPSYTTNTPSRSRTRNLLIRSQMLYPIELWARDYYLYGKSLGNQ